MFPANIPKEKGVNIMGTKKTMLVLACALVMVFAMSTCAFAAPQLGGNSWSSYSYDLDVFKVGVDVDVVDINTTLDNSDNKGIILQNSDKNDIIAIDDVAVSLEILTLYSGNVGSFNTTVMDYNNTTVTNCNNQATFTFTGVTNAGSFNTYDIDVNDSFNYSSSVSGNWEDQSYDLNVIKSFNDNTVVNYQDQDFIDYDDNDLVDIDAALFLNLNQWGYNTPSC
jgi:hypothetical protein